MLKHPTIPTSLNIDKLLIEDKIFSWNQEKKKLSTPRPVYTLPRKEKHRLIFHVVQKFQYQYINVFLDQS